LVNHPLRGNVEGILTSLNPDTPEGLDQRLSIRIHSGRASALEQTRAEKSCQTLKDFGRASVLELRGGLPIGREALRPSEPRHSPNKVTHSYHTKKESFASGISKMWCVYQLSSVGGVFIAPWGSSTDLVEAVTHQVSLASIGFLHLAMWPADQ
jgi:hypothetical protein